MKTLDIFSLSLSHVNPRTQDFTVIEFASIQAQITSVVQSISLFLATIAAVSLLVGIISGVAPARSAAKMNPVDALRFEQ
jgi:ABC-type antimicrobial peptide transport system permease subunit